MSHLRNLPNPIGVLAALVLGFVSVAGLHAADDVPSGHGKGPFQELAGPLNKLLKLTIDDGHLLLDRSHWDQDNGGKTEEQIKEEIIQQWVQKGLPRQFAERRAEQEVQAPDVQRVFQSLQQNAGTHSAGMRSSNNFLRIDFAGPKLMASFERQEKSIRFEFAEQIGPQRRIQIADNGQGAFRLSLATDDASLVLILTQRSDGSIAVAELSADRSFTAQADSFLDFYGKERDYVEDRLFPLLEHVGILLPLTRFTPAVQQAVLGQLEAMKPANAEEFEKLVSQLDDEDFSVREAASARITSEFRRFGPLARQLADDEDAPLSPETQARLGRLVDEFSDDEEAHQFANAGKLNSDVDYLVTLLEELPETARPILVERLAQLTDQKLGTDPAAWRAWYKSTQVRAEAAPAEKP